jgi:hypothetical protein
MDTYVLSAAVNWLQKTSPEQQSNINKEVYLKEKYAV